MTSNSNYGRQSSDIGIQIAIAIGIDEMVEF
jgi:hypothetical protein